MRHIVCFRPLISKLAWHDLSNNWQSRNDERWSRMRPSHTDKKKVRAKRMRSQTMCIRPEVETRGTATMGPKASRLSNFAAKLQSADFIASEALSYETFGRHPSHAARRVSSLVEHPGGARVREKRGRFGKTFES